MRIVIRRNIYKLVFIFIMAVSFKVSLVKAGPTPGPEPEYLLSKIKNVDDNGEVISGSKFVMHDLENNIYIEYDESDNIHTLRNLKDENDTEYNGYKNYIVPNLEYDTLCIGSTAYGCLSTAKFPVLIEQISVPKGYLKSDNYYTFITISKNGSYNSNSGYSNFRYSSVRIEDAFYTYDEEEGYVLVDNLDEDGNHVITNKKESVDLSIKSIIDNTDNIKINVGSKLVYRVIAGNYGSTGSNNNVVKIVLPKGLNFIKGSESKNIEYDDEANTIIWKIDYMKEESEEELTFEVSPSDIESKYILNASIINEAMEEEINSNDVEITVDNIANSNHDNKNSIIVNVENTFKSTAGGILIICGVLIISGLSFLLYCQVKRKKFLKKIK